jgi:hypothetical protein
VAAELERQRTPSRKVPHDVVPASPVKSGGVGEEQGR